MKKLMFSAVALIPFSFSGMANTGVEEKLEIKELQLDNFKVPGCREYAIANAVVESNAFGGYSGDDFAEAYFYYLDACNEANGSIGNVIILTP